MSQPSASDSQHLVTTCDCCHATDVPLKYNVETGQAVDAPSDAKVHFNFCGACAHSDMSELFLWSNPVPVLCVVCRNHAVPAYTFQLLFQNLVNQPTFAKTTCSSRCLASVQNYTTQAVQLEVKVLCLMCDKNITGNAKRCSRCQTVRYCSAECQRQHWSTHRHSCQPVHPSTVPVVVELPESEASVNARAHAAGIRMSHTSDNQPTDL